MTTNPQSEVKCNGSCCKKNSCYLTCPCHHPKESPVSQSIEGTKCCRLSLDIWGVKTADGLIRCPECKKTYPASQSVEKFEQRCKKCKEPMIRWYKNQVFAGYHCSYCGTDAPAEEASQSVEGWKKEWNHAESEQCVRANIDRPSSAGTPNRQADIQSISALYLGRREEHTTKRCHSFIKDGQIQFLGDCTHSLAGQTVALPNL